MAGTRGWSVVAWAAWWSALVLLSGAPAQRCAAQAVEARATVAGSVDSNVVYGTFSGLALLMDVDRPARPNGLGVIFVPGIGWSSGVAYGTPLFNKVPGHPWVQALTDAGFTVFQPAHRTTPRFTYPGPVEDVQRAARFIRAHAARFGVDAGRLGGWGGSSGAYMVSMLGVLDGAGDAASVDAVERESSKLACVVAFAAPTDLLVTQTALPDRFAAFVGAPLDVARAAGTAESRMYRAASPLTHVSADAAAFYLVHGDADDVVPVAQSERFAAALAKVGRPAEFRRIPGAGHVLLRQPDAPRVAAEAARWLTECLRRP